LVSRIAEILKQSEGLEVPVITLDITPYRDDLKNQIRRNLSKRTK